LEQKLEINEEAQQELQKQLQILNQDT